MYSANFGDGEDSPAVQFGQVGPPVMGLRVQTLDIRELLTEPMRDRSPCSPLGSPPTQLQTREHNEGVKIGKGGIKKQKRRSRHASATGRQATRSVVQCSHVEVTPWLVVVGCGYGCGYCVCCCCGGCGGCW